MVRKIISIILCVLFVASLPLATNAESYTAANFFDHEKVDVFKSLLNDISIFDNYVLFKYNESYIMLVGDLEFEDNTFVCSESCLVYELTDSDLLNYTVDSITLDVNNKIYYSDLGNSLDLYSRLDIFSFIMVVLLFVISLCCLVRPVFNFVLRFKGR